MTSQIIHQQGLSDIWPLVFYHLSSSPLDIINLTLTCSEFRWIARPLCFQKLTVTPLQTNWDGTIYPFSIEEVQWQLERLQFWALPRIAPVVKTCRIMPPKLMTGLVYPDANAILNAVITTLPAFVNLRELAIVRVNLTRQQLVGLNRIQIWSLHLIECLPHMDGPPPHLLRVTNLILDGHSMSPTVDAWLRVTQLDALITLSIVTPHKAHMLMYSPLVYSLLSLRHLHIHINADSQSQLILLASRLPVLEHLAVKLQSRVLELGPQFRISLDDNLDHNDIDSRTTLESPLSYHGPITILPLLRLPKLQGLRIEND
jgi:hypothetical protein